MFPKEVALEICLRQLDEKEKLRKLISGKEEFENWILACESNLNFLNEVVKKHGWPNADKFKDSELGRLVEACAWFCVQHGDSNNTVLSRKLGKNPGNIEAISSLRENNPEIFEKLDKTISKQRECFEVMKYSMADIGYLAFLEDRILRNECKPQIYGTQYVPNPLNPSIINVLKDEDNIDITRQRVGLVSYQKLKDNLKSVENGEKDPNILLPPSAREIDFSEKRILKLKKENFETRDSDEYGLNYYEKAKLEFQEGRVNLGENYLEKSLSCGFKVEEQLKHDLEFSDNVAQKIILFKMGEFINKTEQSESLSHKEESRAF